MWEPPEILRAAVLFFGTAGYGGQEVNLACLADRLRQAEPGVQRIDRHRQPGPQTVPVAEAVPDTGIKLLELLDHRAHRAAADAHGVLTMRQVAQRRGDPDDGHDRSLKLSGVCGGRYGQHTKFGANRAGAWYHRSAMLALRASPWIPTKGSPRAMSQSLVKNLVHLVYSTKNRQPWITKEHRAGLFAYQAGIFQQWDSPALRIGGAHDHVHALFSLSRNHALKKVVEEVKKASSKWMKTEGPRVTDFYWQAGYGAFSVSLSNVDVVERYIDNQDEHHRQMTYQEELRALLRRHQIEFDERYLWD